MVVVPAVAFGAVTVEVMAMANTPMAIKRTIFCIAGGLLEGPILGLSLGTKSTAKSIPKKLIFIGLLLLVPKIFWAWLAAKIMLDFSAV
jgi:hypothetical protein